MNPPRAIRTAFLVVLLVAAGSLTSRLTSCSKPRGRGYNVVLVTLDTTRPDFFGCYGHAEDTTPNFDALAREGARFGLAITSSALTPVSHASILTGLNPYGHGLRVLAADGGFKLRREIPSLAPVLKDAGYRTAAIHSAFPVSAHFGFDRGFDVFESFDLGMIGKGDNVGWDTTEGQRRSDETTDRVLDQLERTDEPFFLWVHYWDPHDVILTPPEEYVPADAPRTADGHYLPSSRMYAAELRYVDAQFGRLMADLQRRGMWEDSLIVVVADHGEGLEDGLARHGWQFHRILYQEQIHVPLIVRAPGNASERVIEELVRTIDIYPTVLDYLELEAPREVEGRTLRPLVEGRADEPRIAYADQINLFDLNASMVQRMPESDLLFCAMDSRWKLIYRPTRPERSELYDLRADPEEQVNLRGQEDEHYRRLLIELAHRQGWVLQPFELEGGGSSEETLQLLAKLGYVDGGSGEGSGAAQRGLAWEWVCPEDAGRSPRAGRCEACAERLVPVGSFR